MAGRLHRPERTIVKDLPRRRAAEPLQLQQGGHGVATLAERGGGGVVVKLRQREARGQAKG